MILGREYPEHPMVGVGAVLVQDGRVLLIRRGREPARGQWSFPGGLVEAGEALSEAVRREVLEETGLTVKVLEMASLTEIIHPDDSGRARFHYVLVDFYAEPLAGRPRAGDDAVDISWVDGREALGLELTPGVRKLIVDMIAAGRL